MSIIKENLRRVREQIAAAAEESHRSPQEIQLVVVTKTVAVATQRDVVESRLISPIVGHVGDGNFHLSLMVDLTDGDEVRRAEALLERLVERALAMDGTCTGEHGIGQGKMKYLKNELGQPALAAMAAIKQALDPQGIMNPGKIVSVS
jgi:D-lactate dehydrogenase (cytochrome)